MTKLESLLTVVALAAVGVGLWFLDWRFALITIGGIVLADIALTRGRK